jgi:hypothetical protein
MMCEKDPKFACMASVELVTPTGRVIQGTDLGEWLQLIPTDFPARLASTLPPRRASNLFEFRLSSTESYTIDISPEARYEIKNGELKESYLEFRAVPTRIAPEIPIQRELYGTSECISPFLTDACHLAYTLPAEFQLRVRLLTVESPQGWVNGRILKPEIRYTPVAGMTEIFLSGRFLLTPSVSKRYFYSNLADRDIWGRLSPFLGASWDMVCGGNPPRVCGSAGPGLLATNIFSYTQAAKIDPDLNKATALNQKLTASFHWKPVGLLSDKPQCEADGLAGFIGSNALTFEGVAPRFNPRTQTLDYKVSSPHLMPNGKTFEGVYELIVSRKLADCIWGTGTVKVKAWVQVLSDQNSLKVHTSTTRETPESIALSVYGFNYSESTVSLRLERDIPAVMPEVQLPAVVPNIKPRSIVCVTIKKPTKLKRVTGFNPRCPKGYKRR